MQSGYRVAMASKRPGFGAGMKSLWGGFGWLIKTPAAWPAAMVPIALVIVLSVVLTVVSIAVIPGWVGAIIGPTTHALSGVLAFVVKLLATVIGIVLAAFIGFSLAQPLAGPALEALVRRREIDLGLPPRPNTSMVSDMLSSLQSLLVSYAFGIPAMVLLFVLSLVMPTAVVVLFPLELLVAAITVSWDFFDYPMAVRGVPVGHRIGVVFRNFPALLGFSVGLALAGLVPGLLLLLMPGAVAGATELLFQIERTELDLTRSTGA